MRTFQNVNKIIEQKPELPLVEEKKKDESKH
jgi:hypothetical protein